MLARLKTPDAREVGAVARIVLAQPLRHIRPFARQMAFVVTSQEGIGPAPRQAPGVAEALLQGVDIEAAFTQVLRSVGDVKIHEPVDDAGAGRLSEQAALHAQPRRGARRAPPQADELPQPPREMARRKQPTPFLGAAIRLQGPHTFWVGVEAARWLVPGQPHAAS